MLITSEYGGSEIGVAVIITLTHFTCLFTDEYATLLFRKHLKKTPQKDPLSIESEINQTITDLETFIDSSVSL